MNIVDKLFLENLRRHFPPGARVKLIKMNDPYNTILVPGSLGTVVGVDDIGTIHVSWDCGSTLGVVYEEDVCEIVELK